MNALITQWYWCIFASMSLVLVMSVSGLLAVWLWPASPPLNYFVVPRGRVHTREQRSNRCEVSETGYSAIPLPPVP